MAKKIIIILAIIILAGFVAYKGVSMFGKNKISGRLIDAVLTPEQGDSDNLIVLTDGSLSYISKTRRPGKKEVVRKGIFCKTFTYLYNPYNKEVIRKIKTKYDSLPPDSALFLIGDQVWDVCIDPNYNGVHLRVLDAKTGDVIMTAPDFKKRFSELSMGISQIIGKTQLTPNIQRLYVEIRRTDGKLLYYDLQSDRLFSDKDSFSAFVLKLHPKISVFTLMAVKSGEPMRLYRLTGIPSNISSIPFFEFARPERIEQKHNVKVEMPAGDKGFIDAWVAYQDEELAVIVHQDKPGQSSPRRITCVDSTRGIIWSLGQEKLLPAMARSPKDPFSDTSLMKSRLRAKRKSDVLLIVIRDAGLMGINIHNGTVLWRLET